MLSQAVKQSAWDQRAYNTLNSLQTSWWLTIDFYYLYTDIFYPRLKWLNFTIDMSNLT